MYYLDKLSYLYQDLEPFIDVHTIGVHYHKHAKNYLKKLNKLLNKTDYDYRYSLDELYYHINEFPCERREDILFNLGGVLNHNIYFKSMSSCGNEPTGKLKDKIINTYGSYGKFWKKFKKMALKLKGSGYTFLVVDKNDELDIINVNNQVLPISLVFVPLFAIDMWEHAYYLNYKNEKKKYLSNFKEIADFNYASKVYNSMCN